jgi:hypothetical protein
MYGKREVGNEKNYFILRLMRHELKVLT